MKLNILIRREYTQRVRNKTFVISTLVGLLVIIGLSFAPAIQDMIKSASKQKVTVFEQSGEVSTFLDQVLRDKLPNGEREFTFKSVQSNPTGWDQELKSEIDDLIKGNSTALLEISPPQAPGQVILHTKKIDMGGASNKIRAALQNLQTQQRVKESGLSQTELGKILAPVEFKTIAEGLKATTQDQQANNMMLVYFLLFLLYFSLIVYGMYVASGVVEEKSSRVMEMMLATIEPTRLMAAKIIGIGAAGLTQYIIWIGAGIGLITLKSGGLSIVPGVTFELAGVDPLYLLYFGAFFILGFLLYASLYAGIASTVSRAEDTNQAVNPITYLIVIGFMVAMYSMFNPDNPWVVGLSYVPFFTPLVFFSRIVLTPVPWWQILLAILDLLVSTTLLILLAGKLYRTSVLMYGKVCWRDLIKIVMSKQ